MDDFNEEEYERDFPREILHSRAEVMLDENWYVGEVEDISASGARLKIELDVSRGMDIFVNIGSLGPFNATVAWCNGGTMGIKFAHDPEEMSNVLLELEKQG